MKFKMHFKGLLADTDNVIDLKNLERAYFAVMHNAASTPFSVLV